MGRMSFSRRPSKPPRMYMKPSCTTVLWKVRAVGCTDIVVTLDQCRCVKLYLKITEKGRRPTCRKRGKT